MADTKEEFPVGSQLAYPDGSGYVYLQASEDLESNTYVDVNANERICKLRGGMKFPVGILTEGVRKDQYTWLMVRPPRKSTPAVG